MRAQVRKPDNTPHYDEMIQSESDWPRLGEAVVDPIIYRAAEVFVAGPMKDSQKTEQQWNAIAANIYELIHFFDLLTYHRQLPMIDYGYTFVPPEGFAVSQLYGICNSGPSRSGKAMVAVAIGNQVYETAKEQALKALENHGPIDMSLRDSIEREMTAFDYEWDPHLGPNIEANLKAAPAAARHAATFLYGDILFGIYAKRSGSPHVSSSKRSRLSAAAAMDAPVDRFESEQTLFKRLEEIMKALPEFKQALVELPPLPSVLPYLLNHYEPKTPRDLLHWAIELRGTDMLSDLWNYRSRLITEWRENEEISDSTIRELRRLGQMLGDQLAPYSPPDATTGITAYLLRAIPVRRLWNWTLSNVPGSHMKLLLRLHSAARPMALTGDLYGALQKRLEKLWGRAANAFSSS